MESKIKQKRTGIRAKQRFYNWAVKHGLDLKNFEPERIEFEGVNHTGTFKSRAEQIKEKFNHVFKFREQDFIKDYPNIEILQFVKK